VGLQHRSGGQTQALGRDALKALERWLGLGCLHVHVRAHLHPAAAHLDPAVGLVPLFLPLQGVPSPNHWGRPPPKCLALGTSDLSLPRYFIKNVIQMF